MIGLSVGQGFATLLVVLVVVNSLVLLALIRQVGLLLLRVGQVAPPRSITGPAPGETLPLPVGLLPPLGKRTLIVFVSTSCGTCDAILPAVRSTARRFRELDVVLVGDSSQDSFDTWLAGRGGRVSAVASPGILEALDIPGTPFACVVDQRLTVLNAAGANHLDHLEALLVQLPEEFAHGEPEDASLLRLRLPVLKGAEK
jgi:hypothetical protein